ncbi:hypothetical protein HaLaN_28403 [Haematococcus lacustris]|uniref:Uncharacterized protein n=1 Tax=Haematococcus lacustris TaxID=44745 RepID=A0A6A0ACZ3_HAELA|nr:hypothetical protein HaLaN_28403 [Haematococcus lacustris]
MHGRQCGVLACPNMHRAAHVSMWARVMAEMFGKGRLSDWQLLAGSVQPHNSPLKWACQLCARAWRRVWEVIYKGLGGQYAASPPVVASIAGLPAAAARGADAELVAAAPCVALQPPVGP